MVDKTILTMPNGSQWLPATSKDVVQCVSCSNEVDTPEEIELYPDGNCPQCGAPWTGEERRSTIINVTMPQGITGGAG